MPEKRNLVRRPLVPRGYSDSLLRRGRVSVERMLVEPAEHYLGAGLVAFGD